MQLFVVLYFIHIKSYILHMLTLTFTEGLDMYGGIVMPPLVR